MNLKYCCFKICKRVLLIIACFATLQTYSQKTKFEKLNIVYYKLPQLLLDSSYKTYAVIANISDYMGGRYAEANMKYSMQHLKKVPTDGDIEVMLNYSYYKYFANVAPVINKVNRSEKVNGVNVTTTYYTKSCSYDQPYEYSVENRKKSRMVGGRLESFTFTITTPEYATEAEVNSAWDGFARAKIAEICTASHLKLASEINGYVNALFFKGDAPGHVELYTTKSKKDYADLDSAFTIATEAYALLSNHVDTSKQNFRAAIGPAMQIWQQAVSQKEGSKKARINPKIANVILFNLAYASYWQCDWDSAIGYANAADENDKSDYWTKAFIKNVINAKNKGRH